MKRLNYTFSACIGMLLHSTAYADQNLHGFVGVYTVPNARIEIKNAMPEKIKDSGEAYGVVAELSKDKLFGYIHYETASIDLNELPVPGVDSDEYRVGVGVRQHFSKGSVDASVEYFDQTQKFDFNMIPKWTDSGIGFHVNGEYLLGLIAGKVPVAGFADIGYIAMDKSDAMEYRFGLKSMLSKHVGIMMAYRIFKQEKDDSAEKTTLQAMNIGLSYVF